MLAINSDSDSISLGGENPLLALVVVVREQGAALEAVADETIPVERKN